MEFTSEKKTRTVVQPTRLNLNCSKCALLSFARRRIPVPMFSLSVFAAEDTPVTLSSRMCTKGAEDEATDYDVAVLAQLIVRRL